MKQFFSNMNPVARYFCRIAIGVCLFFVLIPAFLFVRVGVQKNFAKHALYYVQHMPRGKDVYPEPIILLRFLDTIPKIPESEHIYRYELGPLNVLSSYDESLQLIEPNAFYIKNTETVRFLHLSNRQPPSSRLEVLPGALRGDILVYDPSIQQFVSEYDYATTEERERRMKEVYAMMKSLMDYQKRPLINLQFLFNWKYQKEFIVDPDKKDEMLKDMSEMFQTP